MVDTLSNLVLNISQIIHEKKGNNIIALDIRGISSMTDFVIIANGNVDRHVIALAKEIIEVMESFGHNVVQVEGLQNGDWIVLDYSGIIVHLFVPEMRKKYQLQRLWSEGKIIDLDLQKL